MPYLNVTVALLAFEEAFVYGQISTEAFPVPRLGETFNHDSDDDAVQLPLQVTLTVTPIVPRASKLPLVGEIDIWLAPATPD